MLLSLLVLLLLLLGGTSLLAWRMFRRRTKGEFDQGEQALATRCRRQGSVPVFPARASNARALRQQILEGMP